MPKSRVEIDRQSCRQQLCAERRTFIDVDRMQRTFGNGHGLRLSNCKIPDVTMTVKAGGQKGWRNRLSNLCFLVMTVGPWVVMIWLLWPH